MAQQVYAHHFASDSKAQLTFMVAPEKTSVQIRPEGASQPSCMTQHACL
jgi:hypothetical protein